MQVRRRRRPTTTTAGDDDGDDRLRRRLRLRRHDSRRHDDGIKWGWRRCCRHHKLVSTTNFVVHSIHLDCYLE